jgi:hypothetical protein
VIYVNIKVADEVWIGCALLHRENDSRESFSAREIVDRVAKENIYGRLRPGVQVHVSLHCVANVRPNPGNYRMLYQVDRGQYRLFKKGKDDYHPYREGGKIRPEKSAIPEKYSYLVDWYENEYIQS